jgi:hypothetical protein
MTTSPFQYSPLSGAEKAFRLLHILPGTRQDDIECLLVESELAAHTDEFEAISYVWGDVFAKTPIQVNSHTLYIGSNLRSALLNLRLTDRPRAVWADAICINQEDLDERIQQVGIMGDIYRGALRTVVWLGAPLISAGEDVDTPTAFGLVSILGVDGAALREDPLRNAEVLQQLRSDESITRIFFRHKWWERAWTAQEIVLAKRALLVSGRYQVDWDLFCSAVHHGTALGILTWGDVLFGNNVDSETSPFREVQAIRHAVSVVNPNPADELLSYLLLTRHRRATDPRDKIYSALGFANCRLKALGLVPDYRLPVADVYRDVTRRLIDTSGNLDVLGLCFPFKKSPTCGLPSWVPDWAAAGKISRPLMLDARGEPRKTHASQGTIATPRWDDDGACLVLDGHLVDIISSLGHTQQQYDESTWESLEESSLEGKQEESCSSLLRYLSKFFGDAFCALIAGVPHLAVYIEWEMFVKTLKPTNPPPDTGSTASVFAMTLCTGTLLPGGLQATEQAFQAWLTTLSPVRKLMAAKLNRFPGVFKTLGFLGHLKSTRHSFGEFSSYLTQVYDRRLGGTAKRYLCLLPMHAQVGDQIAILKGGRVPVVLRPLDDGYVQFIGEAYIQGVMDGEAFREEECVEIRIR